MVFGIEFGLQSEVISKRGDGFDPQCGPMGIKLRLEAFFGAIQFGDFLLEVRGGSAQIILG